MTLARQVKYFAYTMLAFIFALIASLLILWLVELLVVHNLLTVSPQDLQRETLYVGFLTALCTIIGFFGVFVSVEWGQRNDNRTVINLTYQIIETWGSPEISAATIWLYSDYFDNKENEIDLVDNSSQTSSDQLASVGRAEESAHDKRTSLFRYTRDVSNRNKRQMLKHLLNSVEKIAIAYNEEHVDRRLIKKFFGSVFIGLAYDLGCYIQDLQSLKGSEKAYCEFMSLANSWTLERNKEQQRGTL